MVNGTDRQPGVIPFPYPGKKYGIIYSDPPWSYNDKANAGKRGACHKYPVMTLYDLIRIPVNEIAADDCALFLWTTCPMLQQATALMTAWGFEFKTKAFCWVKHTSHGKLHWGMGNWTRANTEDCLLGVKGKPKRIDAGVHQVIQSSVQEHSVKPAIVREKIVQLMGDLPRIELFARYRAKGWDAWGLDV